jgi:tetratricopeptide (TPR) repeat protein
MTQNNLSRLEQARQFRLQGKIGQSIKKYREVFESNPKFFIQLKQLGDLYMQKEKIEQAIICYQRLLKIQQTDRANIDILMSLGNAFKEKKNNANAIAYFKTVLQIKPNFRPALKKLEDLYLQEAIKSQRQGLTDRAFTYFKERMYLYSIDMDEVKKKLKEFGIQNYILRLGNAGIGDQLMSAAVTSRLFDFLEIDFLGIEQNSLTNKNRTDGYWPIIGTRLMNSQNQQISSYSLLGIHEMAIDTNKIKISRIQIKEASDEDPLNHFFEQLLKSCQTEKSQNIVPPHVPMRRWPKILPFLTGSNSFIDNLKAQSRHHISSNKSCFQKEKQTNCSFMKILFHLRLGDVAPLDNLIPNKIIYPYIEYSQKKNKGKTGGGIFNFSHVPTQGYTANYHFLNYFQKVSKRIKTELKDRVVGGLITDGCQAAFSWIKKSDHLQSVLQSYGVKSNPSFLDQKEKEKQDIFMTDFQHLDAIIYGEEYFHETVASILDADILITSTGNFSFLISEYLRNKKQKRIIFNQKLFFGQDTLLAQNPIDSPEAVDELVCLIKTAISELNFKNQND